MCVFDRVISFLPCHSGTDLQAGASYRFEVNQIKKMELLHEILWKREWKQEHLFIILMHANILYRAILKYFQRNYFYSLYYFSIKGEEIYRLLILV